MSPVVHKACFVDLNVNPAFTDIARCITARQDAGVGSHPRERSGVFQEIREGEHDGKFVLIVTDANGETHYGVIRKLTPRECWRLQGFTNEQFNIWRLCRSDACIENRHPHDAKAWGCQSNEAEKNDRIVNETARMDKTD